MKFCPHLTFWDGVNKLDFFNSAVSKEKTEFPFRPHHLSPSWKKKFLFSQGKSHFLPSSCRMGMDEMSWKEGRNGERGWSGMEKFRVKTFNYKNMSTFHN
jgi:hypothetical protein